VRAVIDTNVLLSGLLWHGTPHSLLEQVRGGKLVVVCSSDLLTELETVIDRPKFASILTRSNVSSTQLITGLRRLVELVEPPPLAAPVCRDPDDDAILALALAAQVDLVVSGDDDLLSLRHYRGIPIVTPAQALQRLGE